MRRRIQVASTTIALLLGVGLSESWGQTFAHQQSLRAWGISPLATHQFGLSVAISGDTLVVGGQQYYPGMLAGVPACPPWCLPDVGSAYVFVRSNGTWTPQQILVASDGSPWDRFGAAVAISGERIVIGAPNKPAAYIFERNGGVWTQQYKLQAPSGTAADGFGSSVAIIRDAIVVGAPWADHRGLVDAGSAYVFENSGVVWIPQELLNQPPGAGDGFGSSVAIGPDKVVVGAPGDDGHGTVAVFARSGGVWSWQHTLVAIDAAAGDGFGNSVALSGTTVAVGAPGDDDESNSDTGSAHLFTGRNGVWSQRQKLVNPGAASHDKFGLWVALSGTRLVVGIPYDALPGLPRHGTAVVYESSGGNWNLHQWFRLATGTPSPVFAGSVAISDQTVVVGASGQYEDGGGTAEVFATETRPTIQAATLQSPPPFVVTRPVIAGISDHQDLQSALTVTVNGGASATVNGVTVSAISVDQSGTVTADVLAVSANANVSFVLRVTDTTGLFAEATLVVRNFTIGG